MKKILTVIFSVVLSISAYAGNEPDTPIMIFELNGKTYYITDEKLLENLIKSDICIAGASAGDISELYLILYNACKESIATLNEEATKNGIKPNNRFNNFLRNIGVKIGVSNLAKEIGLTQTDKETILRTGLKNCLITKEALTKTLSEKIRHKTLIKTKITTDINKCINSIGVLATNDTCPLRPSVPDIKYIENILDLNTKYRLKSFQFPTDTPINTNKIIVFNGNVLVACENGAAIYLVRPTYSGRETCQNGKYQNIPGSGGTPNGIYVVREQDIQKMPQSAQHSWGQYRAPLIPANETNTFGRTNMYLHGTTDPTKHRSGGCISLGLAIDKFIETGFITGTVPVIVNTDTVYQDWK